MRQRERGFLEQNEIKRHLRNRLNLKTLDALCGFLFVDLNFMPISGLPSSTCETERYLRSIDSLFFLIKKQKITNQDCKY